jgi:RND family efflux transporter MFP subunit
MKSLACLPIFVIPLLLSSCQWNSGPPATESRHANDGLVSQKHPVKATIIKKDTLFQPLRAVGRINPSKFAQLSFRVPGEIVSVKPEQGKLVKKGDTLAIIDNPRIEIDLRAAISELKLAEIEFESLLLGQGGDSSRLTGKVIESLSLRAGVISARHKLEKARYNLDQCYMTAPFSGMVEYESFETGTWITAGEVIGSLKDIHELEVEFLMPVDDVPAPGENVFITITPCSGVFWQHTVDDLTVFHDKTEQNLVVVKIPVRGNVQANYWIGRQVNVSIHIYTGYGILIPKTAVVRLYNDDFVLLARAGRVFWQVIDIRQENDELYLIEAEIMEGDTVLTEGHQFLAHEAEIAIEEISRY